MQAPLWSTLTPEEALVRLGTSAAGLSSGEAIARLKRVGPNLLQRVAGVPAWRILVAQFRTVVVALLVVASILALLMGDGLDAAAIAAVLVINAALGFTTELRAKRSI